MWPRKVDWRELPFGVELEFVDAEASRVARPPGWTLDPMERQLALTGEYSGGEIQSPPLTWAEREQIVAALAAILEAGGDVNWSCGLHVHVGLASWGSAILPALLDAVLATQSALRELFATPDHRMLFCPSLTRAQRDAWLATPHEGALRHAGRPQGARCGVNVAAWYDFGTVELRYPNATLDAGEVMRSVELFLRWVSAVGSGASLPSEVGELVETLGVAARGYPAPHRQPAWHLREELLTELMAPVLQPLVEARRPGARILFIRPTPEGFYARTDSGGCVNHRFWFRPRADGFEVVRIEDP